MGPAVLEINRIGKKLTIISKTLSFLSLAILLTGVYLVYQYWGVLFKYDDDDEDDFRQGNRLSRSRSRSCSRSRSRSGDHHYKMVDSKHGRRGRKAHRRCPDCSLCNYDK